MLNNGILELFSNSICANLLQKATKQKIEKCFLLLLQLKKTKQNKHKYKIKKTNWNQISWGEMPDIISFVVFKVGTDSI